MKQIICIIGMLISSLTIHAEEIRIPREYVKSLDFCESEAPQCALKWPKKKKFKLENIETLEERLKLKIHGQDMAVKATVNSIIRFTAGLQNPNSPIACMLYIGPTGVGKTQLAIALTQEILGDPKEKMLRLDMSEYQYPHDTSRLIGSPPGYVGYDSGGQLTNWLKTHPCSVILLDEIDKAAPEVLKLFLHVFDAGRITSASGDIYDCNDCIFILTTNYAAQKILALSETDLSSKNILEEIRPELIKKLSPELYNRLDPVVFLGLSEDALRLILSDILLDVSNMTKKQKNLILTFDETVYEYLMSEGFDYELGARPLQRLVKSEIVTLLSTEIVNNKFKEGDLIRIAYDHGKEEFVLTKE